MHKSQKNLLVKWFTYMGKGILALLIRLGIEVGQSKSISFLFMHMNGALLNEHVDVCLHEIWYKRNSMLKGLLSLCEIGYRRTNCHMGNELEQIGIYFEMTYLFEWNWNI